MTMPLSASQKRRIAFSETVNLIALFSFLSVASLLTLDPYLFAAGCFIEAGYLWWATKSARYGKRAEAQMSELRPKTFFLDRVLLLVTTGGLVVILFFGFGKHLLTHPYQGLSHAAGWETGALVWTGCFTFYYVVKYRVTGKQEVENRVFGVSFFLVILALIGLAWFTKDKPIWHVCFVLGIGLCFFFVDRRASRRHEDKDERELSKASFWWADVPMVATFLILLAYLWFHRDTEHPDVFVSGVIACQLLMSNAIFIAMEFEFLKPFLKPTLAADQDSAKDVSSSINGAENSLVLPAPSAALSSQSLDA